jgi:hypothetical protein
MHIVGNLISLSSTLSQTSSQLLDNASSDVADHATNYGQHAASPRTSASTIASAARQAWGIPAD